MAEKNEAARPARAQPGNAGAQAQSEQSREGGAQQGTTQTGALQRRSAMGPPSLFRLSPFSLVRRMMEDMDRMFEAPLSGRFAQPWWPAIETSERGGQFVVRADLPGLGPDDVRIEEMDGALLIEGERRSEAQAEEEGGVVRSERMYGRFSRQVPLPEGANPEAAQARFENGVLEITVPLREAATRRRRIEIQGARQGSEDSSVH
jgi:HSP20 family protein